MNRLLLTILLFAFIIEMPQAQVLKRAHKKSAKQSEQIVANETIPNNNSIIDQLSRSPSNENISIADISKVPAVYNFDWRYDIKIENKEGENFISYLLKKDASYYAMKVSPSDHLFMVLDPALQLMVMFMETDGKKMMNAAQYNFKRSTVDYSSTKNNPGKYKLKKVGNKNILGFNCKGYQVENEEGVITFYITSEPDINFKAIYNSDKTNLPQNFNPDWFDKGKGILMQLSLEGMKNAKNNMTLTCIKLYKEPLNLKKADYSSIAKD